MTDVQTEAQAIAQKLQDVVVGTDGWLNVDKAADIIATALAEWECALWRVFPNTHTIPSDHPLGKKTPDPFEGPGETYRNAYERVQSELVATRQELGETRLVLEQTERNADRIVAEFAEARKALEEAEVTISDLRSVIDLLEAEALSRTGAVKVKALDEDDYEEIINAAGIALRNASHGIRGQVITVYDSLGWWVMKETERRILSALEPAAPCQT